LKYLFNISHEIDSLKHTNKFKTVYYLISSLGCSPINREGPLLGNQKVGQNWYLKHGFCGYYISKSAVRLHTSFPNNLKEVRGVY
jgi:hypothetical protein